MQRAVRGVLGLTSIFLGYFWVLTQALQHSPCIHALYPGRQISPGEVQQDQTAPHQEDSVLQVEAWHLSFWGPFCGQWVQGCRRERV